MRTVMVCGANKEAANSKEKQMDPAVLKEKLEKINGPEKNENDLWVVDPDLFEYVTNTVNTNNSTSAVEIPSAYAEHENLLSYYYKLLRKPLSQAKEGFITEFQNILSDIGAKIQKEFKKRAIMALKNNRVAKIVDTDVTGNSSVINWEDIIKFLKCDKMKELFLMSPGEYYKVSYECCHKLFSDLDWMYKIIEDNFGTPYRVCMDNIKKNPQGKLHSIVKVGLDGWKGKYKRQIKEAEIFATGTYSGVRAKAFANDAKKPKEKQSLKVGKVKINSGCGVPIELVITIQTSFFQKESSLRLMNFVEFCKVTGLFADVNQLTNAVKAAWNGDLSCQALSIPFPSQKEEDFQQSYMKAVKNSKSNWSMNVHQSEEIDSIIKQGIYSHILENGEGVVDEKIKKSDVIQSACIQALDSFDLNVIGLDFDSENFDVTKDRTLSSNPLPPFNNMSFNQNQPPNDSHLNHMSFSYTGQGNQGAPGYPPSALNPTNSNWVPTTTGQGNDNNSFSTSGQGNQGAPGYPPSASNPTNSNGVPTFGQAYENNRNHGSTTNRPTQGDFNSSAPPPNNNQPNNNSFQTTDQRNHNASGCPPITIYNKFVQNGANCVQNSYAPGVCTHNMGDTRGDQQGTVCYF